MRVLFIANHLNVGGISSYLLTLAGGLKQKGHQVYLVSGGGELEDKFIQAGVTLLKAPLKTKNEISPKIIFSFWKLRKAARKFNIDLIHSHSRTTQVLGDLLSRSLAKPHIFSCHGFFKPRLSRRLFPCWGQKVIAVSQQVKEHLICDFKLDAQKISVIHNGIDTKNFGDFSSRDNTRAELGVPADFLVGIIARLSEVKGHIYLIQAMLEVIKNFPNAKLLIVGQGKTRGALIKETQDLGLESSIIFIPETKNTKHLLAAMDIFVMPSLQEGLGLALMEAMAQGVAVVGCAVGGIKTLIQDKVNGLLAAPADAPALARAIITLLGDSGLRRALGARAREFIMANFSQEEMVDKTEKVYQQSLKTPGA
ncbi:MAG: glycosyltransferase family 4 protein [Candidatus Omnitrophica bacterium]|nr:glycosyltransferase family 4 protein [Candidatus Omnitrophota bacterium]